MEIGNINVQLISAIHDWRILRIITIKMLNAKSLNPEWNMKNHK